MAAAGKHPFTQAAADAVSAVDYLLFASQQQIGIFSNNTIERSGEQNGEIIS